MAVEQNPDFLNEITDDWFKFPGDAHHAWKVVTRCVDEGREIPDWVKRYLRKVAVFTEGFDRHRDGTDGLANALGFFPESEEPQTRPAKALYDSLDVFSTIAAWRLKAHNNGEKLSLLTCFERYINEKLNGRGEEETIKTAYYRGKAIAEDEIAFGEMMAERG
jgi:hypothetical protein